MTVVSTATSTPRKASKLPGNAIAARLLKICHKMMQKKKGRKRIDEVGRLEERWCF